MNARARILLTTFGSYGDIHPFMAIAMELRSRGHEAVIATFELYRDKVEGAGIHFCPIRPALPPPRQQDQEMMDRIMEPRSGPKFLIEEVILSSIRESYEDLLKAAQNADLLVSHPITFAGPLVAGKLQMPWISTILAPMSFVSAYDPPVPPVWPWLVKLRFFGPGFMKALLGLMKKSYSPDSLIRFRQELGIPDYGHPLFEGQHSPHLVLALFSSLFAKPQPDWPNQTCLTGFPFYDGSHEIEMPGELLEFLKKGSAPIVFTLGSSAVWVAQDFFKQSIAAAKHLGRRAVLLIGDERNLPVESLPAEVIAVNYAPYESLLPQACAMVHHGGIGTTSQGLRAGIPTLIVPFAFDQYDNAAHAERLGSSRTLYRKQYIAARVPKELDCLLSHPKYLARAEEVRAYLRNENGAKVACDLIENFLESCGLITRESLEFDYATGH